MSGKQLDDPPETHPKGRKQVLFIRHGESEAHIGKAASHIEIVGLTESGKTLASRIANDFLYPPDLIITSPYLRAWETAEPTMKRFPEVPREIWQEVREFTYLGSLTGQYLTKEERSCMVTAFWEHSKPEHQDHGAESFVLFILRTRQALYKLAEELKTKDFIVVFTHEQFIRAAQCLLLKWKDDAEYQPECMKDFRTMLLEFPLDYGYKDDESWQLYYTQKQDHEPLEALPPTLLLSPEQIATK